MFCPVELRSAVWSTTTFVTRACESAADNANAPAVAATNTFNGKNTARL
jgi:hypothetical protein